MITDRDKTRKGAPGVSVQPTTETGELRSLIVPATAAWLRRATGTATLTLEIGCGPGQYRLAVNGRYIGVDRTAEPYREGLPRLVDAVAELGKPEGPAKFEGRNMVLLIVPK